MYAVIETGGKQYRVALGDRLKVEKLAVEQGQSVDVDRVLMVAGDDEIAVGESASGHPVRARVLGHGRRKKLKVFKMKRRKNYRRTRGHRQDFTEIEIIGIGDQVLETADSAPESEQEPELIETPSAQDETQEEAGAADDGDKGA
ncbi:MAG: 50S ribosomal protein L21 [Gammaproteobacteria bacterium]|nr:50S ribosomal protein L21 [Gammaproteobacteria bacterium]MYD76505.1 50S ribosomal protein L21 [Gammaproteobacteria bacterium]MYJ52360.1 50S ribosomal protein L21 [Gammaproteobacteria bacterium]